MDRTQGDRAKDEPKRTAGDDSWDVWSNYLFCPTLCRTCEHFYEVNSNWPYHCKGPSSRAVSHKSKKENNKQYDHCEIYEEKKKTVETPVAKSSSKEDEYEQKRISREEERNRREAEKEERERERQEWRAEREREEREKAEREAQFEREMQERSEQWAKEQKEREAKEEYDRVHCFYCGEQGFLVKFHSKHFHEKCLNEFKNKDNGKEWITQEEKNEMYEDKKSKAFNIKDKYKEYFDSVNKDGFDLLAEFTKSDWKSDVFKERVRNLNLDEFSLYVENKYKTEKAKQEAAEEQKRYEQEQDEIYSVKSLQVDQIVKKNDFTELLISSKLLEEFYGDSYKSRREAVNNLNLDEFSHFVENKKVQREKEEKELAIKNTRKNKNILIVLSLFFGFIGADRFYAGRIGLGILKFLTVGGWCVWWLIDFILAIAGKQKDRNGNYIC